VNSRLYDAWVSHERHYPVAHEFRYHLPVFIFDLAELESGAVDGLLFRRIVCPGSLAAPGPALPRLLSLRERDYLHPGPGGLRQKLARALEAGGLPGQLAQGHVRLVTSARFLGYGFNPVNFWLVYADPDSKGLAAAVAEVNNTFGEKHIYVLGGTQPATFPASFGAAKVFHVSPFNDMEGEYLFSLADGRRELDLCVDLHHDGRPLLEARLWSDEPGRPVTTGALASFLFHPQRVLTYPRILRQAASLYARRKLPVHAKPEPASPMTIRRNPTEDAWLSRLAQRVVLGRLDSFSRGALTLELPSGQTVKLGGRQPGHQARMAIRHYAFFTSLLRRGSMGLGESYVDGYWETDDLQKLFAFFLSNETRLTGRQLPNPVAKAAQKLLAPRRVLPPGNSRSGSRANVSAHYDLSNQAFALFLDPGMTYSCAVFADPDNPAEPLEEAQQRKLRMMAQKAGVGPGDRVLEIGCGWGSFAVLAAREFGCQVTALTLSREQFDYVSALVRRLGLENAVEPVFADYRDHQGEYDAVVSIEMIEAVGHRYHQAYFRAIDRLLAPGGRAVIQAITIIDQRYDAYRQAPDWINTYIFPGGLLPSLRRISQITGSHTSLQISDVEDIGRHYAPTLVAWRDRFHGNWDQIARLGFDERFRRTFDYYFSVCEAGFRFGHVRDVQVVLERPLYHADGLEDH